MVAEFAEQLVEHIAACESVAVAFSGGVDSAVVAKAAHLALGQRAFAVTGIGPALSAIERDTARDVAKDIGITHVEVYPNELDSAGYVANAGDRCYFCKSQLYDAARHVARERDLRAVLNGTNADDLGDYRPGLTAADEAGVLSPLVDLGLTKPHVRDLARHWQLPVWDKPASPCLASRIAPGVEVTAERLAIIEAAEAIVRRELEVHDFRVRLEHNDLARIEVPFDSIAAVTSILAEKTVVEEFLALGLRAVTLDLAGFQSGSLNVLVPLAMAESASRGSTSSSGRKSR